MLNLLKIRQIPQFQSLHLPVASHQSKANINRHPTGGCAQHAKKTEDAKRDGKIGGNGSNFGNFNGKLRAIFNLPRSGFGKVGENDREDVRRQD